MKNQAMNKRITSCRWLLLPLISFVAFLYSSGTVSATAIHELFNNYNKLTVYNGPSQPTKFTIQESYEITLIETYHWNSQQGKSPGHISLIHNDGTIYGPWTATGRDGYLDVPNAYWQVKPYKVIKPGTYTIKVSDPGSWSYNSKSNYSGHAKVYGIYSASYSNTDTDKIFNFVEDMDFGEPIFVPKSQETICNEGLCFRQYNNYSGFPLYLATYQGSFWLYFGEFIYLGSIQEWLKYAGYSSQPADLDGTWKRDDGLVIEISGQNAYFVSLTSSWQNVANAGFIAVGDLKMRNIQKVSENKWVHEDLWWRKSGGSIVGVYWSSPDNSSITMNSDGNTLTVRSASPIPGSSNTSKRTYIRQ